MSEDSIAVQYRNKTRDYKRTSKLGAKDVILINNNANISKGRKKKTNFMLQKLLKQNYDYLLEPRKTIY